MLRLHFSFIYSLMILKERNYSIYYSIRIKIFNKHN
nr:MAG TPA: hypothetical protein [Caudoviricetes sp.]